MFLALSLPWVGLSGFSLPLASAFEFSFLIPERKVLGCLLEVGQGWRE